MRQLKSKSFEFFEPDQIEQANVVEYLVSLTGNNHVKIGGETWSCAWAPDSSYFAWSSGHRILHLIPWDSKKQKRHNPLDEDGLSGRKYHVIDCAEHIWSLAFGSGISEDDATISSYRHCRFDQSLILATGLASGRIKLWNCNTGNLMIELLDHKDTVRSLDFTKDGSLQLLSASRDGSMKLWDLHNEGNMYSTHKSTTTKFYGCRFSPNGKLIAAVGSCRMVHMWKKPSLDVQPYKLSGHSNEIVSCDFSPDSALLATAAYDTKVIIWDTYSMSKLRILGHLHPSPRLIFAGGANDHYVRDVTFRRGGLSLATACDDGYVRCWKLNEPGDPKVIHHANGDALSCQFSPDGSVLAVGYRNGDVEFVTAGSSVPSLLQLSRQVVRKQTSSDKLDDLPLPSIMIKYLGYRDLVQIE